MPGAADPDADAYEELFRSLDRLKPGVEETPLAVLERVRPFVSTGPPVAGMGCGSGVSALALARRIPAHPLQQLAQPPVQTARPQGCGRQSRDQTIPQSPRPSALLPCDSIPDKES